MFWSLLARWRPVRPPPRGEPPSCGGLWASAGPRKLRRICAASPGGNGGLLTADRPVVSWLMLTQAGVKHLDWIQTEPGPGDQQRRGHRASAEGPEGHEGTGTCRRAPVWMLTEANVQLAVCATFHQWRRHTDTPPVRSTETFTSGAKIDINCCWHRKCKKSYFQLYVSCLVKLFCLYIYRKH